MQRFEDAKRKDCAQAEHACVEAVLMALKKENRLNDIEESSDGVELNHNEKTNIPLSEWFHYGCAKVCVYVDLEAELLDLARKATERDVLSAMITDAGITEFHGIPTKTCLALEPLPFDVADELTGHLSLY